MNLRHQGPKTTPNTAGSKTSHISCPPKGTGDAIRLKTSGTRNQTPDTSGSESLSVFEFQRTIGI
jgi:hypothetical protein